MFLHLVILLCPVLISTSRIYEDAKIERAQSCEKPVEVIEPASVDVLRQPRRLFFIDVPSGRFNDVVYNSCHKTTQATGECSISRAYALHGIGGFLIKELQEADDAEDFGHTNETVLNQQPISTEVRHGREESSLVFISYCVASSVSFKYGSPCN
ncbi:hypothetical protein V8G54_019487 [Vigna mungo]|uniref:Uncharacterized protein n=1 Tax=Vigna mungo TaxID=3915 RepID=A0AAQ3NC16_VIGMU